MLTATLVMWLVGVPVGAIAAASLAITGATGRSRGSRPAARRFSTFLCSRRRLLCARTHGGWYACGRHRDFTPHRSTKDDRTGPDQAFSDESLRGPVKCQSAP